jgi:hypothetical protein
MYLRMDHERAVDDYTTQTGEKESEIIGTELGVVMR